MGRGPTGRSARPGACGEISGGTPLRLSGWWGQGWGGRGGGAAPEGEKVLHLCKPDSVPRWRTSGSTVIPLKAALRRPTPVVSRFVGVGAGKLRIENRKQ